MKVHAAICKYFREYLNALDFTEIQSSKFQEATAESGAAVFKVDYFRKPVYLAQSPQLAKQMCIAADMERVYEIGPGRRLCARRCVATDHERSFPCGELEHAPPSDRVHRPGHGDGL
jgi:aspartyl/asparaginyl-tRNA synthetase